MSQTNGIYPPFQASIEYLLHDASDEVHFPPLPTPDDDTPHAKANVFH